MKHINLKNFLLIFILFTFLFTLTSCENYIIEKGDDGINGQNGKNGKNGQDGENGIPGDDAKKPEIKVDEEGLWWRLEGESTWTKLMTIDDLSGHAQKYTINLKMDGEIYETIEDITYKTTVEIKSPNKENYTFLKWIYENGNEYTQEDIITQDITLEAVFGSHIKAITSTLPEEDEPLGLYKEVIATHFNTYGAYRGEEIVYNQDNKVNVNWTNIGLKETYLPNIYEVTGIGTAEEVRNTYPTSLLLYHINCTSEYFNVIKGISENKDSFIGKIVKINNLPTEDSSTESSIQFKFFTISLSEYENVYLDTIVKIGEKVTLPTINDPSFLGWSNDNGKTIITGEIIPDGNATYLPIYKNN